MAEDRITFLHEFDANGNPGDIVVSERRTIGQALGITTQKTGQRYTLDTDGSTSVSLKPATVQSSRYTEPLTIFDGTHQGGAFSAFEEAAAFVEGAKIVNIQNTISNYGELSNIRLIKGKEKLAFENSITFPQILSDMNTPNGRIAKNVSENLIRDNGFDNDKQRKDSLNDPVGIQTKYGVYDKADTRFEIQLNEYKNLGIQLLFAASGEFKTLTDPSSSAEQAAFLLSSPLAKARMGVKVASIDLYPSKILKKEHPEFIKDPNSQYYGDPGFINGAPYNPLIMFEGFSNGAQTAMCYILFTALFATVTSIAATYEAMHNREESTQRLTNTKQLAGIGRLFGLSENQVAGSNNFFGLVSTKFDYTECVRRGLRSFFGFGVDGSAGNAHLFINNPGYSMVVLRMIISNTVEIFGNSVLSSIIPGGIPSNTSAPSGVVEAIGQATETLDRLKNSKLLRFMNIVAHLGDIILQLEDQGYDTDLYAGDEGRVVILTSTQITENSSPDVDILGLRNAVKYNRLSTNYGKGLSWATRTTPNFINYTSEFNRARNIFTGNISPETNAAFLNTMQKQTPKMYGSKKIDPAMVKKIEQQLGYSYFPFYFQDLRTNEVISFHGFLSDLNDSHSTDYETSESYGRAGSVHHYKNIRRKISFRFWMVATSKEDFDLMWFKLNRILAMSQPMYTKGRDISYKTEDNKLYKFTQPFSQIPGATPIVRVRIGDLITSNYSDVDAGRLFGSGNPNTFALGADQTPITQTNNLATLEANIAQTQPESIQAIAEITVGQEIIASQTLYALPSRRNGRAGTITNVQPNRTVRGLITINPGQAITIVTVNPPVQGTRVIIVRLNTGNATYEMSDTMITGCCSESPSVVEARQQAQSQNQSQTNQSISQNNSNDIVSVDFSSVNETDWLKGTPIFKSFESAAGEGVMAVIESIDPQFDMGSMVWEDEPGSVAPKAFEVSVAISPMYDINPGIAADGQMIGAIYRPGRINHSMKAIKYPADKIRIDTNSAEGTAVPSGQPPSASPASTVR